MSPTAQLVVMAKRPQLGLVKTRLASGIGAVEATRFFRRTVFGLLRRVAADPRWQTVLALAPDGAIHDDGIWPHDIPRIAQGSGDLGARMGRLMRDLPQGPVVIVGGDIPDIAAAHIADAFGKLRSADVVFGPADDGGYWLVGMRRHPRVRDIFGDVRWSSEYALADTQANAALARLTFAHIATLSDIDTAEDYAYWRARRAR